MIVEMKVHERPDQGGLRKSWLCGRRLRDFNLDRACSAQETHLYYLLNIDDGLLTEPKVVHGPMERWCPRR